jgi:hypothetical protein
MRAEVMLNQEKLKHIENERNRREYSFKLHLGDPIEENPRMATEPVSEKFEGGMPF